jgi:hypothetical protein
MNLSGFASSGASSFNACIPNVVVAMGPGRKLDFGQGL